MRLIRGWIYVTKSYQHQAEVAGDKLYSLKEQLLVFDGVNDPVPALPGGAPMAISGGQRRVVCEYDVAIFR